MTDLQDDRSLVRNLLNLGLDLYVVDWGNPSRADRYLTLDDYITGYLDDCVAEIARRPEVREGEPTRASARAACSRPPTPRCIPSASTRWC